MAVMSTFSVGWPILRRPVESGQMRKSLALLAFLLLAACAKPTPPQGRWEGGYDGNGVLVAARVEIGADGRSR